MEVRWELPPELLQAKAESLSRLVDLFQIPTMLIGWWKVDLDGELAVVAMRRVEELLIGSPATLMDEARIERWAQGARNGERRPAEDHSRALCA